MYLSLSLTCPLNSCSLCLTNSSTWRCARRRERQTSRIAEWALGEEESKDEAEEDEASPSLPSSSGVQQLRQSVSMAELLLLLLPLGASERAEASASQVEQSGSGNLL